ncbi:hypothetical protein JFL43_16845 [Viridibacillus sp. YIM B01967]|uniref:Permease n=1 Tax=Viridibacillus soli TaxID=2798301 RepID=A0ABS1HAQ9_9BACL|nr:hypothetical protein [Viridibacillus soli]MBK3496495.1 hypothetical protein [Viridibacillus soli]
MNFVKQIVSSAFLGFVLFYFAYVLDMGSFKMESGFLMVSVIISIVFCILYIIVGIVCTKENSMIIAYQTVFGTALFLPIYLTVMENLVDAKTSYVVSFIISITIAFLVIIVTLAFSIRHYYFKKM